MDVGVEEGIGSKASAGEHCTPKLVQSRLPLKALDVTGALLPAAQTKVVFRKRRKSSGDQAIKSRKTHRHDAASALLNPNTTDICSEVTSSCDSDKLQSAAVISKVLIGPLDEYTRALPQPDHVGISSTIDEDPKHLPSGDTSLVVLDSDDEQNGENSVLDESSMLNESATLIESQNQSLLGADKLGSCEESVDTRQDEGKNSSLCDVKDMPSVVPGGTGREVARTSRATVNSSDMSPSNNSANAGKRKRSLGLSDSTSQKRTLVDEKKRQKEAEVMEKKKRVQEEKDKREQEKQAKEAERKQKLEEKERERQEKLTEKVEKRKRRSEIELKQLEEKRKKDDEKQKAEEEKQRRQQAQKNLMFKFLKKTDKCEQPNPVKRELTAEAAEPVVCTRFKPFEVKAGMKLAPVLRRSVESSDLCALTTAIATQVCERLYLQELKDPHASRCSKATIPHVYQDEEVHIVEAGKMGVHMCKKKRYMRAKLLQFVENYRPAYYGTWRKRSSIVTPRRPLTRDTVLLNYDVDSDDEWDEEEPGESTSVKDEDEEDEGAEDGNEEMDPELKSEGFLVEHGYLSEGEGADTGEEEGASLEQRKEKQRMQNRDWEQSRRKQRRARDALQPVIIGCCYEDEATAPTYSRQAELDVLRLYQAVMYASQPVPTSLLNPELRLPDEDDYVTSVGSSPAAARAGNLAVGRARPSPSSEGQARRRGRECRGIPEGAMPDLIRLVHGSVAGFHSIVKEFVAYWKLKGSCKVNQASNAPISEDTGIIMSSATASLPVETMATTISNTAGEAERSGTLSGAATPTEMGGSAVVAGGTTISKRQLELKVRGMAVYEKRPVYKRSCWYVLDEVIDSYFGSGQQHSRSELTVPTSWKYVTKQQKASDSKSRGHGQADSQSATTELSPATAHGSASGKATTPARQKQAPSAGITPITNFTVSAAECKPRRIALTTLCSVTPGGSTASVSTKLSPAAAHDSTALGKATTPARMKPAPPAGIMPITNFTVSAAECKPRRIALTTLCSTIPEHTGQACVKSPVTQSRIPASLTETSMLSRNPLSPVARANPATITKSTVLDVRPRRITLTTLSPTVASAGSVPLLSSQPPFALPVLAATDSLSWPASVLSAALDTSGQSLKAMECLPSLASGLCGDASSRDAIAAKAETSGVKNSALTSGVPIHLGSAKSTWHFADIQSSSMQPHVVLVPLKISTSDGLPQWPHSGLPHDNVSASSSREAVVAHNSKAEGGSCSERVEDSKVSSMLMESGDAGETVMVSSCEPVNVRSCESVNVSSGLAETADACERGKVSSGLAQTQSACELRLVSTALMETTDISEPVGVKVGFELTGSTEMCQPVMTKVCPQLMETDDANESVMVSPQLVEAASPVEPVADSKGAVVPIQTEATHKYSTDSMHAPSLADTSVRTQSFDAAHSLAASTELLPKGCEGVEHVAQLVGKSAAPRADVVVLSDDDSIL